MLSALGEEVEAADEVVHVAEAAGLRAVAKDGDRPVRDGLPHESRNCTAVVRPHAWPIRIEDPGNTGVHALLPVVRHCHRLGVALGLVVHAARPNWVDVTPVRLRLGVYLRITVHLAR